MRGIRGAITVEENSQEAILAATKELMKEIVDKNQILEEEIVSVLFTATVDLDQVYPALAVRQLGFDQIPLLCFQEMNVVESLKRCIRILVHVNRDCSLDEIKGVYLGKAKSLRPDLYKSRGEISRGEVS